MKLPLLDYPQRLPNNAVGLLQYNNFNLNVLDLRFYLDINVKPYSISNQLLIVKTDESMFGLIIDKAGSIIELNNSKFEYLSSNEERIIESMYKEQGETISIINLEVLESTLRKGVTQNNVDIPSLFPKDDDSKYILLQRNQLLQEKSNTDVITYSFSQNKYISFRLNEDIYCIALEHVKEFLKDISITPIPCNANYIVGIVALQGNFITVIDIKNFFGIGKGEQTYSGAKNNIIIVEFAEYTVGFLVDELFSIINIPEEKIEINNANASKYILSETIIEDRVLNILNLKSIFSDEKFFIEE